MESPPENDSNLADAAKRVAWRLLAVVHNRAELLMLEIQEERERARIIIFLACAITLLSLLAGITLTALIVYAAGTHRLIALIALALLYIASAVFFCVKLGRIRQNWESLTGTRNQLEKDRECFEKILI